MFLEPSLLSMAIAKLRGGKLKNLSNVEFKGYFLFISAFLLQGLLAFLNSSDYSVIKYFISNYSYFMILLSYTMMIVASLINFRKVYMRLFLIGIILNFIVIMANGGKMPVYFSPRLNIEETVIEEREYDIIHTGVDENTKLVFLADIITIPKPYPLPKILSIGDVFIMAGVFMFFQKEMLSDLSQT
ncbi:hypothetical protein E8P77_03800 [Soehngenia saccharolytica]|nr:hypothetical protein E8P77_03800 [Soehngenia saccharolytica]